MVLVHVSMIPHGTMVLEANRDSVKDLPKGCQDIYNGCCSAARDICDASPDTIIVITPHGISLRESLSVYMNESVAGNAEWNGYGEEYTVSCDCDGELATSLVDHLSSSSIKAEGVTLFSKASSAPLRWGEVVPLWFVLAQVEIKVVMVGLPQARFDPITYAESASTLGRLLFDFCAIQTKRIALLFSCDLSHVHSIPPTVPVKYYCTPSLGTDDTVATTFDNLATEWARTMMFNGDTCAARIILRSEMAKWVVDAKACGWSGMCSIQGCMERMLEVDYSGFTGRLGKVHEYQHPSYYGMMVATVRFQC